MRTRNKARREARAISLQRQLKNTPTAYVDAAYEEGTTFIITAADLLGNILKTANISASSNAEAEEAVIALWISVE